MTNQDNGENLRQNVEAFIYEKQQILADAVELVTGERETSPLEVFPPAALVRNESRAVVYVNGEERELTLEEQPGLREVAWRLGIGPEQDAVATAPHHILEGGKVWKMQAESKIIDGAETVIFAGTPSRTIGQDEVSYISEKFGVDATGWSEYETARLLAQRMDGIEGHDAPVTLPFGYAIRNRKNAAFLSESTGQLIEIGKRNGQSVQLLRVDHDVFDEEDERGRMEGTPESAVLMRFIGDVLTACGNETDGVALNTSNTYSSRVVDEVKAGLQSNRTFEVGLYGRDTINALDAPVPAETPIHQIPGELHTYSAKLAVLQTELQQQ